MQKLTKSSFKKPGVYQIKIEGKLDQKWSSSLSAMQVKNFKENESDYSVLTGELTDQAALNGILNSLYNMHYKILKVMCL